MDYFLRNASNRAAILFCARLFDDGVDLLSLVLLGSDDILPAILPVSNASDGRCELVVLPSFASFIEVP